ADQGTEGGLFAAAVVLERLGVVGDELVDGFVDAAATDLGLIQSNDTGPVDEAIDKLIADNPQPLQDYRGGKQAAFGALVGMVMRNGKGLNPKLVQQRLREKLTG
ncbi:MAG: Asp-tRNA(Asn)/Glu-tRNA(Gln) amidotransferase GatCAB subunit B, partial [Planctomycetota bacterium]